MKIQYGRPNWTSYHVVVLFVLGSAVIGSSYFNAHLVTICGELEKSILESRKVNVTNKTPALYCDLPYDDCLCSVLSNKSHASQMCITNVQLVGSRILPFISFLLQIFLVRQLFSLSGDHRCVIICVLWISSIPIFIGMTISIYWSRCYHVHLTLTLFFTGTLLCLLSLHDLVTSAKHTSASFNLPQPIIADESERSNTANTSERTNNANRSWLQLL